MQGVFAPRPVRSLTYMVFAMRIAQVSPLYEAVPPRLYGGTERVVAHLCDALVGLGHDVTLFASAEAQTGARLTAVRDQAIRLDPAMPPGRIQERRAIVTAILAKDPAAARAAMVRRTASARREIIDALTTSTAVTSASIALP